MRAFLTRHRGWILALALLTPCLWFAFVHPTFAQGVTSNELLPGQIGTTIGTGTTDIRITIARIIRVALGLLGTVALLLILYAGFVWMTAAGDETKVATAKKTLTGAIIGLVIILSAFGIVSFILSSLVNSTTGGNGGAGGGGGGGGGGGFGGSGGAFRPMAIQPAGSIGKYDVVAAVTFSAAPTSDTSNITANILLEKVAGGSRTAVEYEPIVENNTIRLRPVNPCPAPNGTRRCLEPNADYQVTVRAGLKNASSSDPRSISCGIGSACVQSFRTGAAVTTEPPTVAFSSPTDGQSVPAGDLIPLQTLLTDQNGIATVEYSADGAFFTADGSARQIAPSTYASQAVWDTAGVTPVRSVALSARGINIDGDEASSTAVHVTVRPQHCFNVIKDADEAAIDCGGASCGACTGGACTGGGACASGQCVNGQCVENPQIVDVQLRDGKPGNLVTITGRHFGTTPGKVTFLGGAASGDEHEAAPASCSTAWTDTRIAIVVPAGAVTGPIEVSTTAGKKDATNDAFGPIIDDFQVNDTARPGICGVSPVSIKTGQTLTLTGAAFGATQSGSRVQLARAGADCAQIQDWTVAAEAAQVSPWTDTSIRPTVPNVETTSSGANYLVHVVVGGQSSNTACVRVEPPEAGTEPRIDFVTPEAGSVGTYLSLFGANFGSGGTVRFKNSAGEAVGDISFPAQCTTGYWRDASVTVKVPPRFTTPAGTAIQLGAYEVTVVRSDGRASNARAFTVNTAPVPPGICRLEPDNGPVGTPVSIYGDGFGEIGANDLPAFLVQHPDAVRFFDHKNVSSIGAWHASNVTTSVPSAAATGAVSLRTYSGANAVESNGVNFQVRDCRQAGGDASCGSGRSCCGDGACRAVCGGSTVAGGFAWQFSTGPIPVFPVVVENATCQVTAPTSMPSPNPYKGSQDVCTDLGAIAVRFSLPMDAATVNSQNVAFEACGSGATIGSTCAPVASAGAPQILSYDADDRSLLMLPVGGLSADTWYRLTLRDRLLSLGTPERASQALDGNFDGKSGGAYVTTFKTGAGPCTISGVNVEPSEALIAAADETKAYAAFPLSNRCVILSCEGRSVNWSSSDTLKATVAPFAGARQCEAAVTPVSETDPGPAIHIKASVDNIEDSGELTIDYANPRVVEYGPRACNEACVNAVAFAYFNTPMIVGGAGSVLSNVKLYRCRNESCLAFDGAVPVAAQYDAVSNLLTFGNPELAANTYYRAVVLGTAMSTSKAALTGLNYGGNAFSWTFRTRASANPCGPQKVLIEPAETTLRYIGAVATVSAIPVSSPDSCAVNGQILSSASYNWAWNKAQTPANPASFRFLPDVPPGALLNTNPVLPAGCSSSCLMTGSRPPGTPSCGNGQVERGEECDTPGLNGCNDSCLRSGNAAANGCGDGTVQADRGEECDAGAANGTAASGCTISCLLTGSSAGLSVCGNGSTGVGEACDDGNTDSGDGCSASCLFEGSSKDVYVCGNGTLPEPGEECEYTLGAGGLATELILPNGAHVALGANDERNPSRPGFACSQACLLRGNSESCTSGNGCCGNGVIDPAKGEGCDAAADNGKPGSGCSSICLKTGASPELRAFCGDTIVTVKPTDPLTSVQNGGGEECEAAALDANIDPRQALEARNQCDAKNSCTAAVTAAIGTVTGQGSVSVECSCRNDSDCSAFGGNLSCGSGACCYPRPAKPVISPTGGNECRNALVTVTFGEEMNVGSLQGNLVVEACGPVTYWSENGSWLARTARSIGRFLRGILGMPASAASACSPIEGSFQHVSAAGTGGVAHTISSFSPKRVFDSGRTYRVTVKGGSGGAKTVKGVGYPQGDDTIQEFTTGSEICKFDAVQVSPASELLQTADTALTLTATAMTNHGGLIEPIAPVAGVYDWKWSWSTVPEATPPGAILDLTAGASPVATVKATKALNGREQVMATAKITDDTILTPSTVDREIVGKSVITVLLCERPWPNRDAATGAWAPYVDPATHFEFYYCRDNGATALPELLPNPIQGQSGAGSDILRFCRATRDGEQPKACVSSADCGTGDACLSKDLFFRFAPEWKLSDAIGVRVYDDKERLTPAEWYQAQRFSGATQASSVDGYMALQADRTVYVGAVDKYGDPELHPYIYVFAYSDHSDPRTAEIFNRLVKDVRFNTNLVPSDRVTNVCKLPSGDIAYPTSASTTPATCSSDLDCFRAFDVPPAGLHCDSDKDKIRRDMRRWQDIRSIEASLEDVHAQTGFYPKIESGSLVRGFTTSKWPSWSQQLGAAGAIVDPINGFNRCEAFGSECTVSRKACAADGECTGGAGDVCRPKFESETCYDDRAGVFACPAGSHVYQYRAIGGQDYRMNVDFEYLTYQWTNASCAARTNAIACGAGVGCSWSPTGPTSGVCETRISVAPVCAGLFTDPAKRCLAPPGVSCADSSQCAPQDSCVPSGVPLFGPAAGAVCGNGLLEGTEACEVGQTRNFSCGTTTAVDLETCDSSCHWTVTQACPGAAACGNGSLETFAGESCDDGAQTGQYGRCRIGGYGCVKRCVNITKRAAFDGNCADGSCDLGNLCGTNADCTGQTVCTDRMNFCGDGVKNGPEVCDDGAQNGQYGFCAWNCRGPGPRCGDGATNGAEQCDGNQQAASGVCIDSSATLADTATTPGESQACSRDADCGTGKKCAICAATPGGLPQTRTKSCFAATAPAPQACTFDAWSACRPSGACGNGVVEGAEQCDAGAGNSATGACLPTCRRNVCNDGFVLPGVEQCDNGASNGVACTPQYGLTCNYCKNDCSIQTLSGAFCGDSRTGTPPKATLDSPPESCDPGPVSAWCSRTYVNQSNVSGVKACIVDGDCLPGVCRNFSGSGSAPEGAPCHSSTDCGATQFCQGGEGQCTAYNAQCTPAPYSNTVAAPGSSNYVDGSCVNCSSSCVGSVVRSPLFCGDGIKQAEFGEQCDGTGDAAATGPSGDGGYYGCRAECTYDTTSGYCGNGVIETSSAEQCDKNVWRGTKPTCAALGAGVGQVLCSNGCANYTGGCSEGQLLPGDFRVKINWDVDGAGTRSEAKEVDLYLKSVWHGLTSSSTTQKIYGWKGTPNADTRFVSNGRFADDHIQLFWDSTVGSHEGDPEVLTFSTASLPAGDYYVFANGGTCFDQDNYSRAPDFKRNKGWWKDASAAEKNAANFTIEQFGQAPITRKLNSAPALLDDPSGCVWYIGKIIKSSGSQYGSLEGGAPVNRLIFDEPGPPPTGGPTHTL